MQKGYTDNFLINNMNYCGINPLLCGNEQCLPHHSFGPASREYYLLHFVVSGKGQFTADGVTHHLKAHDCFLIKPHEITFYIADEHDPWHYIWLGFECEIPDLNITQQRVMNSKKLSNIFLPLLDIPHMKGGKEAYLCSKIWEIVTLLSRDEAPSLNRSAEYVSQAISCIETEYMLDISVTELARRLNLDRSYFSTLFKKVMDMSPQKYLNNFRLEKAVKFMTEYDYTVTQAALSTGYSDVFSFSKMFKRHFGVSPAQYKEQHKILS